MWLRRPHFPPTRLDKGPPGPGEPLASLVEVEGVNPGSLVKLSGRHSCYGIGYNLQCEDTIAKTLQDVATAPGRPAAGAPAVQPTRSGEFAMLFISRKDITFAFAHNLF